MTRGCQALGRQCRRRPREGVAPGPLEGQKRARAVAGGGRGVRRGGGVIQSGPEKPVKTLPDLEGRWVDAHGWDELIYQTNVREGGLFHILR